MARMTDREATEREARQLAASMQLAKDLRDRAQFSAGVQAELDSLQAAISRAEAAIEAADLVLSCALDGMHTRQSSRGAMADIPWGEDVGQALCIRDLRCRVNDLAAFIESLAPRFTGRARRRFESAIRYRAGEEEFKRRGLKTAEDLALGR